MCHDWMRIFSFHRKTTFYIVPSWQSTSLVRKKRKAQDIKNIEVYISTMLQTNRSIITGIIMEMWIFVKVKRSLYNERTYSLFIDYKTYIPSYFSELICKKGFFNISPKHNYGVDEFTRHAFPFLFTSHLNTRWW